VGIRKIIKESLSDFDWVGETDGLRNEKPKKGDTINVVYNGPRDQSAKNFFLAILGKYRRPFKLGVFGENIRGEVIDIGSEGYVLKEINTGYEIYIPSPEHIEKQKEKAKRRVQKRGIPKLNFKFDFEFYHIIEPNSEPSVNESDDFDWVRDINPIPNEILNISKYREGNYKFWLGDISKETQLQILDYISEVIRNNDNLHTNGTLYEVRKRVEKNLVSINSLFFEVKQVDLTKGINLSIMGWYPNDPHFEREERLEYCRNYFYQTDDINLSDVDLVGDINEKFNMKLNKKTIKRILREELNDFDWVSDVVPSDELKTKALELEGKGYVWNFKDYEDFKKTFYELESLSSFRPPWAISPHFEKSLGNNIKKYFGFYQEEYGDFNIFLPYDRSNIYGWFDGQNEASDKDDEKVKIIDLLDSF